MPSKAGIGIDASLRRQELERERNAGAEELRRVVEQLERRVAALERKTETVELLRVVARLEQRVAELERRPAFEYRGVWSARETYKRGDFVTFKGGMWHAEEPSRDAMPGESEVWRLAVKRGRDR